VRAEGEGLLKKNKNVIIYNRDGPGPGPGTWTWGVKPFIYSDRFIYPKTVSFIYSVKYPIQKW